VEQSLLAFLVAIQPFVNTVGSQASFTDECFATFLDGALELVPTHFRYRVSYSL